MAWDIFVVDDDESIRYTVKHGLESLGPDYKVSVFENGKQCLTYLEEHGPPDLIVLDLLMPGMNGWEIQKQLQQNLDWRHIPLVFLSGTQDETSKLVGGLSGCDYIEKPVSLPELKKRIDRLLKP